MKLIKFETKKKKGKAKGEDYALLAIDSNTQCMKSVDDQIGLDVTTKDSSDNWVTEYTVKKVSEHFAEDYAEYKK